MEQIWGWRRHVNLPNLNFVTPKIVKKKKKKTKKEQKANVLNLNNNKNAINPCG